LRFKYVNIEGFIIAGGMSTRMGRDKAELTIGGETFIDRAAGALSSIAGRGIGVVGGTYNFVGKKRVIPDAVITRNGEQLTGALVGLYSALAAARTEWVAVLACDMPFVNGNVMLHLARVGRRSFDAVVPLDVDDRPQPLCALYRRAPCLTAARACLEDSDRSVTSMLRSVRTHFVNAAEFSENTQPADLFLNVNTPSDFERALRLSL
jgi:molybdopterin-guanine dinucleotide biosynthesis protein A